MGCEGELGDRAMKMWVLVNLFLRFVWSKLTLPVQSEELNVGCLVDSGFIDLLIIWCHIRIVVGVLFVELGRKHLFFPRALITFRRIANPIE